MTTQQKLITIFKKLRNTFGKQNWWPGDTQLEVIIGAILTQNTAWKNVEKAIINMKQHGILDIKKLYTIKTDKLAQIIKSAGFFNIKSQRIKAFMQFIYEECGGTIEHLEHMDTNRVRELLLSVHGIGYETADSILLYALNKPVFVVDAYTKRFLKNHNLYNGIYSYAEIQKYFMDNLPHNIYIFNEFHALIVFLCKTYCKKIPLCESCPLKNERKHP